MATCVGQMRINLNSSSLGIYYPLPSFIRFGGVWPLSVRTIKGPKFFCSHKIDIQKQVSKGKIIIFLNCFFQLTIKKLFLALKAISMKSLSSFNHN